MYNFGMQIRKAKISDVDSIFSLISFYAEEERMLFKTKANIFEKIQSFSVAEINRKIVGCCALQVIWKDLAEIQSLAVSPEHSGKGVGKELVKEMISEAKQLEADHIFALTLVPDFFVKMGFRQIPKEKLPMKVWSDCAKCPKQDHCDEIAVSKKLS